MQPFVSLSLLSLLTAASIQDTATTDAYRNVNRLHAAMEISSFPKPIEGKICLWLQESPIRGRLRVLDAEKWPVRATARFFNARSNKNDLKKIVVISDNGRSIRFVDSKENSVVASAGDVVAILLNDDAK